MLIALEDEAAAAVDEQENRARTSRIVEGFVGGNIDGSSPLMPPREIGSASTWSLERLDALAAEASALFRMRCSMGSTPVKPRDPPPPLQPKPRRRSANGSASAAGRRSVKPADGPVGDRPSTGSQSLDDQRHSTDREHDSAVRSQRNSNGSSSGHGMAAGGEAKAPGSRKGRGKGGMQYRVSGAEPSCSSSQDQGLQQSRRSLQQRRQRGLAREARSPVCDYPVQALAAVNDVLFDRHGYRRMDHHGDPKDSQLSAVLERGTGGSAALAILYMEVCERMGLRMAAQPLEGGRYFVLWPTDAPLRSCGQRFVVDAYSKGALFLLDEVCQLFEHAGPSDELLTNPASKREVLAALLATLRDTHWAAAVGCQPEPGLMVPVSLSTALGSNNTIAQVTGMNMERAIAAAERRAYLLPGCRSTQLELCLLYYFAGHHEDAWEELQMLQGEQGSADDAIPQETLLPLFRQKLMLCRSMEAIDA
ncbi:probable UPF0162 protein XF_1494 at C-terminar half [Coccomyxa sp. Obi]|nr:probable UPF0162 protein XF_1494 at C-terminar half [Coccomyxa sp. Obi]